MPGVLPMEICHIYHAIMSLTMHLVPLIRNTQRRNYRDCRAGDSQQSALRPRCTPIPSIFHPAPRRRSVSILEKLLYFSLSKVEKKGKKKRLFEKNYHRTSGGYYFENTRIFFASGRIFENFENAVKHQEKGCCYLGKMIVTRLLRANRNNVNTSPQHYRIITASSIKPFHRVNGHQPPGY